MLRATMPNSANGQLSEPERLLDQYDRGYSTASELMLGVLTLHDESDIQEALRIIPKSVLKRLRHFVGYYTPDIKVFNGPPPNPDTVAFVRGLLSAPGDTPNRGGT